MALLLLSPAIYIVGLIAPLTPSYGTPNLLHIVGFWLAPMGLLASIWFWDRSVLGRASASILLVAILTSYIWIAYPMWVN